VIVPGRLAVMNRPGTYHPLQEDLEFLRGQGVGAIVSLTLTPLDGQCLRMREMAYLHEPVEDFTAPSPEQMDRILAFIRDCNGRGQAALVHCGAGLGRSGTVVSAFLVAEGMGAREAIARVRELRPYSVETPDQEKAVEEYERRLRG
jgi:atypical dual specificity phosphatase